MQDLPIKRDWGYGITACVLLGAMVLVIVGVTSSFGVRAILNQQPMVGGWTWLTIFLVDICTLAGTAYLCNEPLAQLRTRFTEEGLSRPGWFRSRSIRWQDIQEVNGSIASNVRLVTEAYTLSINLYLFKEPDEVLQTIKTHVRLEAVLDDEQIIERILLDELNDARQRFRLFIPSGLGCCIASLYFGQSAIVVGGLLILAGLFDGYRWMRLHHQAKRRWNSKRGVWD